MRIAVIGTKGLPAHFGGIERHCEELYPRLASRGHDVTVFVRGWYSPVEGPYRGLTLRRAATVNHKGLDAFVHTAVASLATLRQDFDIVHYHAIGPSLFSFMPGLRGVKTVATVHALDWQREKWGRGSRAVLKAGERAAARFPRRTIVVSRELQRYFRECYGRETVYIPNGVTIEEPPRSDELLKDFGLEAGRYILFLGRLVPEKGCHDLIAAYGASDLDWPLVIAGGSSHSDEYVERLKGQASALVGDPERGPRSVVGRGPGSGPGRAVFTGYVDGELRRQLCGHAGLFVLPSLVEGLPIVILEMLAWGVPALASDIGPSREALNDGEFGAFFRAGDVDDLGAKLKLALDDLETLRRKAAAGREYVQIANDWDTIAKQTEKVYREVLAAQG